jgi:choice-of-anchor B domain-containing protein
MKNLFLALTAAAVLGGATTPLLAHDDDGKIRDRQKPVRGPVWNEATSDGSVAGTFASNGIQLKSWLPLNTLSAGATSGNSCWGYISPAGREYAIIGTSDGTAFVEITNPAAATLKAFATGPTSLWRDMRVYQNYCYSASEGGSGIQVFDISQLDTTGAVTLVNTITVPTTTTAATHTLAIDTVSGYLYRAGGGANGLRIYDVKTNPANPTYVGAWSPIYVHECQVVTYTTGPYAGKQIAFCCGGTNSGNTNSGLYVVDVTNKAAPVQLSYTTYPGARFCHQGWIDENAQFIYINDELDEGDTVNVTTTIVMNVQNLSNVQFVGKFNNGNPAIGHNMFVRGTKLYEANYRAGVRIFDLAVSATNPPEVAYFDTYPADDGAQFNGLWNVWPFYPSGTVIGSDLERGLFVWKVGGPVATFSLVSNAPATVNPNGGTTVDVNVVAGQGQTLNPASAVMKVTSNGTTVSVPLVSQGGTLYRATFPATTCAKQVSYQFEVANTAGEITTDASRSALSAASIVTAVDLNFEAASGWVGTVAGDTATSGQWVRVDPVATTAQPEDDHSAVGTLCWVTGNGVVGGAAGAADVDAGITTLLSPVYDMSQMDEPVLEYWFWYSNNLGGAPNADSMPCEISNNGGTSWVMLEDVAVNTGQWNFRSWRVRDFITPTANMRVRFVARDLATGSLVEAGIDDFKVTNIDCGSAVLGDLNGDGVVNGTDLSSLLGAWGQAGGVADLDGDGVVGAADLAILVNAWTG